MSFVKPPLSVKLILYYTSIIFLLLYIICIFKIISHFEGTALTVSQQTTTLRFGAQLQSIWISTADFPVAFTAMGDWSCLSS